MITVEPYSRYWAVYAGEELVCVCVYKKGATEVKRRLTAGGAAGVRELRSQITLTPETANTHTDSDFPADHPTTKEELI